MARIPILQNPGQLNTGNQTPQTANLPAVTNAPVGQALSQVSNVASEIAQKAARANDVANLTEASLAMNKAQADFSTFQMENPDESKWLPKWQELTQEMEGKFSQLPLTPEARLSLTSRLGDWSMKGKTQVEAQAFKQAGRKAELAVQNAIQVGQQTGDFMPARQAAADYQAALPMTDEERQAMELQIQGAERKYAAEDFQAKLTNARDNFDGLAMMDAVLQAEQAGVLKPSEAKVYEDEAKRVEAIGAFRQMADVDPIIAQSKLKKNEFPELTPTERDRMESYAEGRLREFKGREVTAFANFVTNGGSPNDFQFAWNAGPAEQAQLKEAAKRDVKLTEQQAASLLLNLDARIGKYDKAADPTGIEAVRISADLYAAKNAAPYAFSDLAERWGKRDTAAKPRATLEIADNDAYIAKIYGPKMDALLVQDGENKGQIQPGKEAEWRRLQSEATEKKQMFRQQIDANPTPEKARKLSQDILTAPVADETVRYFDMFDSGDGIQVGVPSVIPSLDTQKTALPGQ